MRTLWQDLRFGARMLLKAPGFTAIAVVSLALGIGANTALFSIVDAMLLKLLPVKEPDRLALFKSTAPREFSPGSYTGNSNTDPATGQRIMTSFPYQSFVRLRAQPGALSDVFAFGNVSLNVNADGQADVASGQAVSGNYYAGLGVQAMIGRAITDDDDKAAASPVAVISYRYWQRRFGGDPGVVGKQINLNNVAFTVVGVTPPGFEGAMQAGSTQDVSIPIAWEPPLNVERERSRMHGAGVWWLRLMGRLKPDATLEQARAQLEGVFQQSVVEHRAARQALTAAQGGRPILKLEPKDYPRLALDPGGQGEMNTRQYYQRPLRPLGASQGRVLRMILRQGMALTLLGVGLGLAGAYVLTRYLESRMNLSQMLYGVKVTDPLTYGVIAVLLTVVALLACCIPAWRATKVDPMVALRNE